MTVVLLDLALVSYVGSHGTRFDSYLESGSEDIHIASDRKKLSNLHWGAVFSQALEDRNHGAIRQAWQDHPGMREDIAKLICALLELLHLTGDQGQHLVAAYFSNRVDGQVELDIQGNEWAKCLRDSFRTATYAVVGEVCLKCRTRNDAPGICSQDPAKTVFQTLIAFKDDPPQSGSDFVRLDPSGQLFRVDEIRGVTPNVNLALCQLMANMR